MKQHHSFLRPDVLSETIVLLAFAGIGSFILESSGCNNTVKSSNQKPVQNQNLDSDLNDASFNSSYRPALKITE